MKLKNRWIIILTVIAALLLSACGGSKAGEAGSTDESPVKVEHLEGSQPTRITLTDKAAERLDIQTTAVSQADVNGNKESVVPYSAILYDPQGNTWVYTNPAPLTYMRSPITVDYIDNGQAYLKNGPSTDSAVVTTGGEELFGSETEFEEE